MTDEHTTRTTQWEDQWRNDPDECGHGGTIHVAGVPGVNKRCKLCGQYFDRLGREVPDND